MRVPLEAEQWQKQYVVFLTEMMVKQIQQSVKLWLLHPSGKVRHCDLTSHCSLLLLGRYAGVRPCCSAMLFGA